MRGCLFLSVAAAARVSTAPPADRARASTAYGRCGDGPLTLWPLRGESVRVDAPNVTHYVDFATAAAEVVYRCGSAAAAVVKLPNATRTWSLRVTDTRVKFNGWAPARGTSVPFASGSDGYACFKVPSLLRASLRPRPASRGGPSSFERNRCRYGFRAPRFC